MKMRCLLAVFLSFLATCVQGATLYVNLTSSNPTPPYSTWDTAATNIQVAIEAANPGDTVLVTNGVYNAGGKAMAGTLTNRVALDRALTVQSVNGPFVTIIRGAGATNSPLAVRCAWLTNNASLIGFTLTQGATQTSGDGLALQSGGGILCASSNSFVTGCIIVSNTSLLYGCGGFQGTFNSCNISGNGIGSPRGEEAIYNGNLNNCTVVSNTVTATFGGRITNSILYYNGVNYSGPFNLSYCCVTPAAAGAGNFTSAPQLLPDGVHLSSTSPCIGAGTTPNTPTDIFGNAWANPPSVGCVEAASAPFVGTPQVQVTGAPVGFTVGNEPLGGEGPLAFQWLQNGAPLQNNGHFSGTQSNNLVASGATLADAGAYQLVVSNSFGATTSAVVQVIVHCVDTASITPTPPYTNWATAAVQIQDALNAADPGDIILVTNGVYATGGSVVTAAGDITNRVALNNAVAVLSVNGYAATMIEGQWDPVSIDGANAVRCAWLTNGAVLSGFTLANGGSCGNEGVLSLSMRCGGGALLSTNAVIDNCVFTNNTAYDDGAGVAFGTVNNSFMTGNTAGFFGGAGDGGGGAYEAVLNNCTILNNNTLRENSGGGVQACTVNNCIVVGNWFAMLFGNRLLQSEQANDSFPESNSHYLYSCTDPLPSGTGNIDANIPFVDSTFHLPAVSPIRGAGSSLYATGTDLDDQPWANPPSMGCSELVLSNLVGPLSVALRPPRFDALTNLSYGLVGTITGRIESLDWSFGDGAIVTNAAFEIAHTWTNPGDYTVTLTAYNLDNPSGVSTNLLVVVDQVNPPTLGAVAMGTNSFQFSFLAQTNASYNVQYTTNLTPPVTWQTLQTIRFSAGGVITISDPSITNPARFYQVQP